MQASHQYYYYKCYHASPDGGGGGGDDDDDDDDPTAVVSTRLPFAPLLRVHYHLYHRGTNTPHIPVTIHPPPPKKRNFHASPKRNLVMSGPKDGSPATHKPLEESEFQTR